MASSSSFFGVPNPFYTPKTTSYSLVDREHQNVTIGAPMRNLSCRSAREAFSSIQDQIHAIALSATKCALPIEMRLSLSAESAQKIGKHSLEILSQIPSLSAHIMKLDCSLPISDRDAHTLLKNAHQLTSLSMECQLQEHAMQAIASILRHQQLTTLHLFPHNPLTQRDLLPLSQGLSHNDSLSALLINTRGDDLESTQFLSTFLSLNSTVKTLALVSRRLFDPDLSPIGKSLQFNFLHYGHSIHTLHLSMNLSSPRHAIDTLRIDTYPLKKLALVGCNIGNSGMSALCQSLQSHSTLHTLFLEGNHIVNTGAMALASVLKQNTSLTMIDLYQNNIGHAGAQAIGHSLSKNSTLRSLNLTKNPLGTEGNAFLIEGLLGNTTLRSLELVNTGLIYDARIDSLMQRLSSALDTTHTQLTYFECGIPGDLEIGGAIEAACERNDHNLPHREASLYTLLENSRWFQEEMRG